MFQRGKKCNHNLAELNIHRFRKSTQMVSKFQLFSKYYVNNEKMYNSIRSIKPLRFSFVWQPPLSHECLFALNGNQYLFP